MSLPDSPLAWATNGTASLSDFGALSRGSSAPPWLIAAVIVTWPLPAGRLNVELISVSENATFKVTTDGTPVMVVRLHQPPCGG